MSIFLALLWATVFYQETTHINERRETQQRTCFRMESDGSLPWVDSVLEEIQAMIKEGIKNEYRITIHTDVVELNGEKVNQGPKEHILASLLENQLGILPHEVIRFNKNPFTGGWSLFIRSPGGYERNKDVKVLKSETRDWRIEVQNENHTRLLITGIDRNWAGIEIPTISKILEKITRIKFKVETQKDPSTGFDRRGSVVVTFDSPPPELIEKSSLEIGNSSLKFVWPAKFRKPGEVQKRKPRAQTQCRYEVPLRGLTCKKNNCGFKHQNPPPPKQTHSVTQRGPLQFPSLSEVQKEPSQNIPKQILQKAPISEPSNISEPVESSQAPSPGDKNGSSYAHVVSNSSKSAKSSGSSSSDYEPSIQKKHPKERKAPPKTRSKTINKQEAEKLVDLSGPQNLSPQ